jgi:RNAse (barnase) inhibitor barstar
MTTFVIDGNHFNDLEGFYTEIDKMLTKNYPAHFRDHTGL